MLRNRKSFKTVACGLLVVALSPLSLGHGVVGAASQTYSLGGCDIKVSGFEHWGLPAASSRNVDNPVQCNWDLKARVTSQWYSSVRVRTSLFESDGYVRITENGSNGVLYNWTRAQGKKGGGYYAGFYR